MQGRLVEQTRMREAIARRMQESKQQAPHFYVQCEIAVGALGERLAALNGPERVTVTTALARACVAALREHRQFNRIWTPEGLLEVDDINLGIAIALDGGLLAPALLRADALDVQATARALRELIGRARAQRLRPEELGAATFTLSNLGMFDVSAFTAIVTPPQVAILAAARPVERVVLRDDVPVSVPTMTVTLSADHRAVDGADAARFLETFKRALEEPDVLLPEATSLKEAT